ncbi:MAG: hypothetical protein ABI548_14620 [Polyangiaceae bacterium]
MQKLVLLSVIIASLVIPIRATHAKNAKQGLKKALVQMAIFNLIYLILVLYVYPRLG